MKTYTNCIHCNRNLTSSKNNPNKLFCGWCIKITINAPSAQESALSKCSLIYNHNDELLKYSIVIEDCLIISTITPKEHSQIKRLFYKEYSSKEEIILDVDYATPYENSLNTWKNKIKMLSVFA